MPARSSTCPRAGWASPHLLLHEYRRGAILEPQILLLESWNFLVVDGPAWSPLGEGTQPSVWGWGQPPGESLWNQAAQPCRVGPGHWEGLKGVDHLWWEDRNTEQT